MIVKKNIVNLSLLLRLSHRYHNLYDVLGIDNGASHQEIKTKYYQLAKKYHPDTHQHSKDPHRFIKIKQAYEILGDQSKRKQYDNDFFSTQHKHGDKSAYGAYENYYEQRSSNYNQYYSNQPNSRSHQQDAPSFFTLLKRSKFRVILWCAYFYMAFEVFAFFLKKMDQNDRQFRQSLLIQSSPSVIERRKKLYAKQMKQKGIYGQEVDLNCRVLTKESTRSKQKRTQSIISIKGIQKQKKEVPEIVVKPQYI